MTEFSFLGELSFQENIHKSEETVHFDLIKQVL